MRLVDELIHLYGTEGRASYHGERVSQKAHALQSAHQAEMQGAADSLVVAALLHDVGHLVVGLPEGIAAEGVDGRHEVAGEAWLSRHFGPEVTEPIRLHVAAKRYLCAVDPEYLARLSTASRTSLRLQGGPFLAPEAEAFKAHPHHLAAVRLRRWDDEAKVPGLDVPELEHYRAHLERVIITDSREPG